MNDKSSNITDSEMPGESRSYGLRGGKRVYSGYNDERKVKNWKKKEQQHFGYETFSRNFPQANNPLPTEFQNKIITGDSADVLPRLPDNCIDMVLT